MLALHCRIRYPEGQTFQYARHPREMLTWHYRLCRYDRIPASSEVVRSPCPTWPRKTFLFDSVLKVVCQSTYVFGSGQGMPAGRWRSSSAPIIHKYKSVHVLRGAIISNDLELLQVDAEPRSTSNINPQLHMKYISWRLVQCSYPSRPTLKVIAKERKTYCVAPASSHALSISSAIALKAQRCDVEFV